MNKCQETKERICIGSQKPDLVRIGIYSGDLENVEDDEYYDKNGLHIEGVGGWPITYQYDESEHQEIIIDAEQARAMVRQLQEML